MVLPIYGTVSLCQPTIITDMKSAKVFIREIKELAKKGDAASIRQARDKATDALAVHPNNQTIIALIELLS